MSRLLQCAELCALLVPLFLWILIWRLPRLVMRRCQRKLKEQLGADHWNVLTYGGLPDARDHGVVLPSPDMITLFGLYDVSREAIQVQGPVPTWDVYWSIALYTINTDNFYVANDHSFREPFVDLILTGPGTSYSPKAHQSVVEAPTSRGVIIVRALIKNRGDKAEIKHMEDLLKSMTIRPVSSSNAIPVLTRS